MSERKHLRVYFGEPTVAKDESTSVAFAVRDWDTGEDTSGGKRSHAALNFKLPVGYNPIGKTFAEVMQAHNDGARAAIKARKAS